MVMVLLWVLDVLGGDEVLGDDNVLVEEDTYLFEEMPSSRVMAARRSDELIGVLGHFGS